ncbi:hypothetical protein BOX15_Mlig007611g1, partial [Macrostomum lignano]
TTKKSPWQQRQSKRQYQPVDWFTNAYAISSNAERQREAPIRCARRPIPAQRDDNKTKWDQKDNNTRLATASMSSASGRKSSSRLWATLMPKLPS